MFQEIFQEKENQEKPFPKDPSLIADCHWKISTKQKKSQEKEKHAQNAVDVEKDFRTQLNYVCSNVLKIEGEKE